MILPSLGKKVLSIDFGGQTIKIVEGTAGKSGISISKAVDVDLPEGVYIDGEIHNIEILSSEIKETLKENKIKTDTVYGVVNSSEIITRNIVLPKVEDNEIPLMIEYQLEELFPVNIEDYIIQTLKIGNIIDQGIEKIELMLIGIPKHMVISHLNMLKEIGLKPEVLDFQANAMSKLFSLNNLINGYYNTEDMVIASVDIGYTNTKLSLIKNGKLLVTRVSDIGYKTLDDNIRSFFDYEDDIIKEKILSIKNINNSNNSEDEFSDENRLINIVKSTMDNLVESIDMVFRYYTSRDREHTINYIVLKGQLSNIEGLDNLFSNHFGIPAFRLNNLNKIKWDGDLTKYSNAIAGLIRAEGVLK